VYREQVCVQELVLVIQWAHHIGSAGGQIQATLHKIKGIISRDFLNYKRQVLNRCLNSVEEPESEPRFDGLAPIFVPPVQSLINLIIYNW
jgi:hypothetical protein